MVEYHRERASVMDRSGHERPQERSKAESPTPVIM